VTAYVCVKRSSHNIPSVEGVMIGRYYITADEKQAIFDTVINVGTLNIDAVITGITNLKFAKKNLC
jgi:hypothetical protein